eukprot:m.582233 g.582233  ORF g.582233 m.582233 type:complete len:97 (-) comp22336_c0_seq16:2999-3289(-)
MQQMMFSKVFPTADNIRNVLCMEVLTHKTSMQAPQFKDHQPSCDVPTTLQVGKQCRGTTVRSNDDGNQNNQQQLDQLFARIRYHLPRLKQLHHQDR